MFNVDQRLRGLPASREQVVAVYQSINAPHLAIPGKQAGPAQAFIVGLRGSAGLAVYVYLYLAETADCAVYVPDRRNLSVEEFAGEEAEALGFVESMGFIMDNLNFRTLSVADQERLLKTLPVFLKDPKLMPAAAQPKKAAEPSPAAALGRLFASF
ncbi:MAG: social motility and stimulation tgl protein [Myxococcaceae bacterium]|nr:social motility and stimulation tgl protein [Myxococcaceae bacterium]